jgi:hypothetical protein
MLQSASRTDQSEALLLPQLRRAVRWCLLCQERLETKSLAGFRPKRQR